MAWEHFRHGADIGVRGIGTTIDAAFEGAAVALTAVVSTMPSDLAVNLCTAVGGLITDSTLFYDDVDNQPQSINLCDFFANGDIIVTRESQDPTDVVPHATKILRTDTHTMIPPFVTADFEIIDQLLGITP